MGNVSEEIQSSPDLFFLSIIDRRADELAQKFVSGRLTGNNVDNLNRQLFLTVSELYALASDISDKISNMSDYQCLLEIIRKWDSFLYRYDLPVPEERISDFSGSIVKRRRRPPRMIFGQVIKKSSDKTVKVETERLSRHVKYGKTQKITKNYLVHDEFDEANEGDFVFAVEGRPISKLKRHRLFAIRPHGARKSA